MVIKIATLDAWRKQITPALMGTIMATLLIVYWLTGELAMVMLGFRAPIVNNAALMLVSQGHVLLVCVVGVGVMGLLGACYAYSLGGLWAYLARCLFAGYVLFISYATLSLGLYHLIYSADNVSLYPWDWYHLVVLHTPKVSAPQMLTASSLIMGLLFIVLLVVRWLSANPSRLGHTHFAHPFEIHKAGLFAKEGIVLACFRGQKLRAPGFEGALVVAPMGGGKTAAVAIPNLLEWQGSVVVNDLKGELWTKTARYRKIQLGQSCYCWAPADEHGSIWCYNPFAYVSADKTLWYRDLQLIAGALIPDDKNQANFWTQSSRDLFLLLSMYLFETEGMATLGQVYTLAKQEDFVGWLADIIEDGRSTYPLPLIHNASSLLKADAKTRSNILQDFFARTTLFGDPLIQRNTGRNDFDLRALRQKKMSIYVHIPEREMTRLSPLLTLFWVQLIDCLTIKEPNLKEEPYPVMALMDEFGNLARVDKFRKGLSFLRSYRIVFVIILQYLGQITSVYGRDDAAGFLNTKVKMVFTLTDKEDAKYFSDYIGQTTVRMRARSISHGERSRVSINESEHLRPLLRPEEILRLPPQEALVLMQGSYPVRAKKIFWFRDGHYRRCLAQINSMQVQEIVHDK